MNKFEGYKIDVVKPGFWAIDDEKGDSMYLVEGSERAVLIDTCMMDGDLLPMIRELTDKPLTLALTHAHIDHMYHADEFEQCYVHRLDSDFGRGAIGLSLLAGAKMFKMKRRHYGSVKRLLLRENSVIDLGGGVTLRVIHAPGHTPGSVLFVDDAHRAVICGDAAGSGSGAWLWLPGSLKISDYKRSLAHVIERLRPFSDYTFFGGHRSQGVDGGDPKAYPMDLRVFEDMETLCDKMLSGEVSSQSAVSMGPFKLYVYAYGHASMVERRGKIK